MGRKSLIVAINDYGDPRNNLPSCVADARAFGNVLSTRFGFEETRQLLDEEATLDAVEDGLQWLMSDASADDRLVFYFSGHGYQLPKGASIDEVLVLRDNQFLIDDKLSELSRKIPSGTLTVVLDSCFSGGAEKFILISEDKVEVGIPKRWTPVDPDFVSAEAKAYRRIKSYKPFGREAITGIREKAFKLSVKDLAINPISPDEAAQPRLNGLLLSACLETETASASTSKTQGLSAFTFALTQALANSPEDISSRNLMEAAAKHLGQLSFRQTPVVKEPDAPAKLADYSFVEFNEVEAKTSASTSMDVREILNSFLRYLSKEKEGAAMTDMAIGNDKFIRDLLPVLINMISKDYQPTGPAQGAAQVEQEKFLGALVPILTSAIPAIIRAATKEYQPGTGQPFGMAQSQDKGIFDLLPVLIGALAKGYQPGLPAGQFGGQSPEKGLLDILPVLLGALSKGYQPAAPAAASPREQEKFLGALIPILTAVVPAVVDAVSKGYQPGQGAWADGAAPGSADQEKFLGALIPVLTSTLPMIIRAATKDYQPSTGQAFGAAQSPDKGIFDILPVLIGALAKGGQPGAGANWASPMMH